MCVQALCQPCCKEIAQVPGSHLSQAAVTDRELANGLPFSSIPADTGRIGSHRQLTRVVTRGLKVSNPYSDLQGAPGSSGGIIRYYFQAVI